MICESRPLIDIQCLVKIVLSTGLVQYFHRKAQVHLFVGLETGHVSDKRQEQQRPKHVSSTQTMPCFPHCPSCLKEKEEIQRVSNNRSVSNSCSSSNTMIMYNSLHLSDSSRSRIV